MSNVYNSFFLILKYYGITEAYNNYQGFRPILDILMDKCRHFEDAERLLETISNHPNGIQIISELEGFKEQLWKIESVQESQDINPSC